MRRGLALLALLALVAALAGCSSRERANPFDPGNPSTGGRPVGFVALAGDGVITLRWSPSSSPGLEGFQVFRRVASEAEFVPISGVLSAGVTSFLDAGVLNGVDHHYRLFHVFFDRLGGTPAEDVATPGPLRVWVAEIAGGRLSRITPDGRHVTTTDPSFEQPTHVAANSQTGVLWISDAFAGEVVLSEPATGNRFEFTGVTTPGAIALDAPRREAWVCDPAGDLVHHLSETGVRVTPQLGPLDDPLAAAVDPSDGSVWVCEHAGHRVRRFSRAGASLVTWPTQRPSRVAVDSLTRDVWVTSLEQGLVFRLDPLGVPQDTVTVASGPVGVAVDHRRGRVWIADPAGSRVWLITRDGAVVAQIAGIAGAVEVAVDLATGEAWLTAPSANEVIRLSASGTVLRRLGGLSEPYGISLSTSH